MAAVQEQGLMWPQMTCFTTEVTDCRRKKSYVRALTEFTGRDTARGRKRSGQLYYRLQIHPSHIYSGDGWNLMVCSEDSSEILLDINQTLWSNICLDNQ